MGDSLVFQYVAISNTHIAYSALILAVSQQLLSVLSSVNEHQQFCHLSFNCQHPSSMRPYQTALQLVGELRWPYSEPYVEWKFSVSPYLLFFSLSHLEISVGACLSFLTRISWGSQDWVRGFCFCFVFPYLPVRTLLTACRKQNWIPQLNLFYPFFSLRGLLVTPMPYSTSKFRGFFLGSGLACDLPWGTCACKAVEEIPALTKCQSYCCICLALHF